MELGADMLSWVSGGEYRVWGRVLVPGENWGNMLSSLGSMMNVRSLRDRQWELAPDARGSCSYPGAHGRCSLGSLGKPLPHYIDGDTEAQGVSVTCSKSPREQGVAGDL